MKWELALLALCTFASAMVPRERRAVDLEELAKGAGTTTKNGAGNICALNTPCGWVFYNRNKVPELTVNNTYCVCDPSLKCEAEEDDKTNSMYVKKCIEPGKSSIIDL